MLQLVSGMQGIVLFSIKFINICITVNVYERLLDNNGRVEPSICNNDEEYKKARFAYGTAETSL